MRNYVHLSILINISWFNFYVSMNIFCVISDLNNNFQEITFANVFEVLISEK